jgi:hypothetical protein
MNFSLKLEMLSKIPNGVSYGDLRFNPRWGSPPNDPRFEKIIASLEPKKMDNSKAVNRPSL